MHKYSAPLFFALLLGLSLAPVSCLRESPEISEQDLRSYVSDLSRLSLRGRESGTRYSRQAAFYMAMRYQKAGLVPAFREEFEKKVSLQKEQAMQGNSNKIYSEINQAKSAKSASPVAAKAKHNPVRKQNGYVDPKEDPVLQKSPWRNFIQPFRFRAGIQIGSKNQVSIQDAKGAEILSLKGEPFPMARPEQVSGKLIFGGFCLEAPKQGWDDFAHLKADGAILLCLRHGPGGDQDARFRSKISFAAKWKAAKRHGAKGVLFLGREGFRLPPPHAFRPRMQDGPVALFCDHKPFFAAFPFLKKEYEKLLQGKASALLGKKLGKAAIETDFRAKSHLGYNVGAYLRKPAPKQRLLILGAHLDHLGLGYFSSLGTPGRPHLGADDNASGTAAVLELALFLAHKGRRLLPKNINILFLHFDAEERGLIGSRYFVDSDFFPGSPGEERRAAKSGPETSSPQKRPSIPPAEAMLNFDMLGRLRASKGLLLQGCQTADKRWADLLRQSYRQVFGKALPRETAKDMDKGGLSKSPLVVKEIEHSLKKNKGCGTLSLSPELPSLRLIQGGSGPSDHASFYQKKLPVAFFFTGSHLDYHTERDLPEKINYKGIKQIVEMALALIQSWADLDRPLVFRKAPVAAHRADFDFKLRLGIVPGSYESGLDGLPVSAVKEDAPVAKSGLQAGDVIVQLGKSPIRDIDDLMEFLSNASSEKEYLLRYKRGGKVYETHTRLMAR